MKKLPLFYILHLSCILAYAQIQVVTDFEGGNGLLLNSDVNNYVQVESEFKLGDTKPQAIAPLQLSCYPNPTNQNISIKLHGDGAVEQKQYAFNIYDLMGELVKEGRLLINKTTNISIYKKGLFFVRVFDGDRAFIRGEKIVVE